MPNMESIFLDVELYRENGKYCAYISENGSSGYAIKGNSLEHCGEQVKKYVIDSSRNSEL